MQGSIPAAIERHSSKLHMPRASWAFILQSQRDCLTQIRAVMSRQSTAVRKTSDHLFIPAAGKHQALFSHVLSVTGAPSCAPTWGLARRVRMSRHTRMLSHALTHAYRFCFSCQLCRDYEWTPPKKFRGSIS